MLYTLDAYLYSSNFGGDYVMGGFLFIVGVAVGVAFYKYAWPRIVIWVEKLLG